MQKFIQPGDIKRIKALLNKQKPGLVAMLIVVLLIGVVVAGEDFNQPTQDSIRPSIAGNKQRITGPHKVIRVVDGDTIRVDIEGTEEAVRLIGVDTPEIAGSYTELQCYGQEASERARQLLEGQEIFLEFDETQDNRDRYDRLLRYVVLEDGANVNQQIISEGYGYEYTFRTAYRYQGEFQQAQQDARDNQRGLWADDTCAGLTEPLADGISDNLNVDIEPDPGCISFTEAIDYIGAETCVTGQVDNVFVSVTNTTFVNYCVDFRACPFAVVVFESDRDNFGGVANLAGRTITVSGVITTFDGRPQIILRSPTQIN